MMLAASAFVASAVLPDVTNAHGSRATRTLLFTCAAIFSLLPLYGEEPASQIRRVSQFSAKELSDVRERALRGDADAEVTIGLAYDGGSRLFKRDPEEARRWYEMSSKQGNLDAQFWLLGLGHSDAKDARSKYLALAKSGHVGAMNAYAWHCVEGTDGPQAFDEAMLWWKKAAEAGSAEGAFNVGIMYLQGEGVAPNEKEAIQWLRRAADQHSVPAAARLGAMAAMEKGGLKPGSDCTRWLRIAAEAGDGTSMLNLGMVLFHGIGAQPDFLEAYMWFTLASQRGSVDGRAGLRPRMTEEQVAEAEKRAAAWNAAHSPQQESK